MNSIPWLVALPLGMGFLLPLMPKRAVRISDLLANLTTLLLVIMSLSLIGYSDVYRMGGWDAPIGIVLVLDGLSGFMLVVVAVVSLAATFFSMRYMDQYTAKPKYYGLFLLMVAGMNGAILTGDIFNLYVFLEIAAVASYALVAFGCRHEELEASFKYAILGSVASCFILLAVALLYSVFGTVNMAHLADKIAAVGTGEPAYRIVIFSTMLIIAGLGMKSALVPFHAWLPDAHPSAPAPISAMLSGVLIKAIGVYALVRILFNVVGMTAGISYALMTLGTLSMVIGVFMAIGQWDFKRLLAYHSISQIGYVMLGIGIGSPLGIIGGLFHLANHAAFKSLLFLTAGATEYNTRTRQLDQMGGLGQRMPVTSGTSLVASMSIAGVPPFNGFFSKLIIILACVQAGHYWFAGWAVLVSVMTLASFMKVQKYAFYGTLKERWAKLREVPVSMQAAMVFLAILCVAMSLLVIPALPEADLATTPKTMFLDPARDSLLEGRDYARRVLDREVGDFVLSRRTVE